MECIPEDKNKLLEFPPDALEVIRKTYELDKPGAMKQAVDILDTWIKSQHHFMKKDFIAAKQIIYENVNCLTVTVHEIQYVSPTRTWLVLLFFENSPIYPIEDCMKIARSIEYGREYLERTLIANKGSIERSKSRLDRLFTIKNLMPKYFKDYDAQNDFESIKGVLLCAFLPKMTKNYERVMLCKVLGKKFSSKLYLDGYRFVLLLIEYIRAYDYAHQFIVVLDYSEASMPEVLAATDVLELRQVIAAAVESYGLRIKGFYLVTDSKLAEALVALGKQVLSKKLGQRICSVKNYDDLFSILPREIFPKDYGGDEISLEELGDKFTKAFCTKEWKEHWNDVLAARTDETLRQTDKFNDQYMGMPGTFKTLSVD